MLCGLVGGPGLVSGGNFNATENIALFEQATRNAGRKIAGQNIANPTAYLVSTSKVNFRQKIMTSGLVIRNYCFNNLLVKNHTRKIAEKFLWVNLRK